MSQEMDKILTRIQKMLAMANDKANVHESATAAAMAERLMRKYQIEMADVLSHGADAFGARDVNAEFEWTGRKVNKWEEWIAVGCANSNECEIDYHGRASEMGFRFIGVGPDPTVASEMYKYLTREVVRLCKVERLPRVAQNSFKMGAGSELSRRLKEMAAARKAEFQATPSGTALVIHKQALIADAFGQFRYGTSKTSATDYAAYRRGAEAGSKVSLSEQINGRNDQGRLE